MSIALQTLEYLQNEEEYIPWQTASSELSYIDMMLSETNIYGLFQVILQFLVCILLYIHSTFQKWQNGICQNVSESLLFAWVNYEPLATEN